MTPQLAHLYLAAAEPRALQVNVALATRHRGMATVAVLAGVLPAGFMLCNAIWLGPANLAWMPTEKKAARGLLQDEPAAA